MNDCVVIAGGGTGGHLIPGLAVARALERAGIERIVFAGTARGIETRLVPEAGFDLRLIRIGGLKSGSWRRRAGTLAALPGAVWQSAAILRETRAKAVLGIGGYASGPVLAAARLCRVPIVVLEVNAKTGLANRLAARWVRMAAVNFQTTARDFPRAEVTGIPVREEFFRVGERARDGGPVVLIFGGSQGARAINEAVAAMRPLLGEGVRLIQQTGAGDYIADMAGAMAAADVVVCRSGASTLGELAAAGRAAILIPFPGAADQHQLRNAQAYAAAGAAEVIEQSQLSGEVLARRITELLAAPQKRTEMEAAVRQFAHPDAAGRIAELVIGAMRSKG